MHVGDHTGYARGVGHGRGGVRLAITALKPAGIRSARHMVGLGRAWR
jgi:hypothetical protein